MHASGSCSWRGLVVLLITFSVAGAFPRTAAATDRAAGIRASIADHVAREEAQQTATVRQSDSLLNGALIGAGSAIAIGLFLCTRTEPWENCRDDVGPIVKIGAIGAGIGIAVDALIRRRQVPATGGLPAAELHAVPILRRQQRGVQLSLRF